MKKAIDQLEKCGISVSGLSSMVDECDWFVGGDESAIRDFQRALSHLGCGCEDDGVFGPETYVAAEKFKDEVKKNPRRYENGDWYSEGFYVDETGVGAVKFGNKKAGFELDVWSANTIAGLSKEFAGVSVGASVLSIEKDLFKIWTPFGKIVVGGSVDYLGLGLRYGFDKGKLKAKTTIGFGAGFTIGFEDN